MLPAVLAVLLALVSWQVAVAGPLLGLDRRIRDGVQHAREVWHSVPLNDLGQLLSDLGDPLPAYAVLLGTAALAACRSRRAGRRRWWLPLPSALLAAVLIPLLVVPAKDYFSRPGPLGPPLLPGQQGWYPSGHTSTAGIAFGVAALLLGRTLAAAARRRLAALTALLCCGVGLGLVWCDYHWFLDVLAGWSLTGLVLWSLARWLPRPR
ncbi:phosphatase PAP2 family protein [Kitasatospora sp. NPDC052896]|uniref:phosphatase PAP2 family protein n=1 Tax=Kitasatospora sp. NPDC052896 TaxID=3364061 RepID=UPI0037C6D76D